MARRLLDVGELKQSHPDIREGTFSPLVSLSPMDNGLSIAMPDSPRLPLGYFLRMFLTHFDVFCAIS